ncbi:MAG: RsbRD N-terminal domain-containing protein [Desulfovibrio sp.]|nr:RsbRD N-terminal domain-containing protein [Desulfovibrio sp.]
MSAIEILRKYKKDVVRRWVEAVFATYPLETAGFLRTGSDPFTNPVAHMTREAANILYDAMIGEETEPEAVKAALDRFVRLRAVQKASAGQSMAVFYLMKPILKELALAEILEKGQLESFLEAGDRLDTLVLLAFDKFMDARDTIAESRVKEIRNQYAQLRKWAQKLENGVPADDSGRK